MDTSYKQRRQQSGALSVEKKHYNESGATPSLRMLSNLPIVGISLTSRINLSKARFIVLCIKEHKKGKEEKTKTNKQSIAIAI